MKGDPQRFDIPVVEFRITAAPDSRNPVPPHETENGRRAIAILVRRYAADRRTPALTSRGLESIQSLAALRSLFFRS
jgi:hypothetical protein